jgi:hypothetical protein
MLLERKAAISTEWHYAIDHSSAVDIGGSAQASQLPGPTALFCAFMDKLVVCCPTPDIVHCCCCVCDRPLAPCQHG